MKKSFLLRITLMLLTMLCSATTWADTYDPVSTAGLSSYDKNAPIGFGAGVTGSKDENPVTVTNLNELTAALSGKDKKTIYVSGTITFTGMQKIENVSNKTIYGLPGATLANTTHSNDKTESGILTLSGCSNIIIRNLTFKSAGAYDIDGYDNLTLSGCSNIWVDHCDFQDGVDGNLDCNNASDNICVSWCRFRYLISPWSGGSGGSNDHRFSNLWGGDDKATSDEGKLNTTFYACWWDNGCKQRMPRVRYGQVHILNCYYSSSAADYGIGAGYRSNIYVENSAFTISNAWQDYTTEGYTDYNIKLVGNQGADDAESHSGSNTQFVPSYDYTAMPADNVANEVSSHAGATLTYAPAATETVTGKAVLSWYMGANGEAATAANSITGATGCDAEGFTIAITGNNEKNWSYGNGDIVYDSKTYKTLKNSKGAQNTITLPEGIYAHKVEFYVTANADEDAKLSEFNGTSFQDAVSSHKDYTNPTYISKTLTTGVNSFTFTFSTNQVCFIAVVTYSNSETMETEQYTVTFANNDSEATGSVPAATTVVQDESMVIPTNKTLYKSGYTLTGWSDGTNTYAIGANYTPTADVTLSPVFTPNTASMSDVTVEKTVTWYFGKSNGAVDYDGSVNANVQQVTIGESTIDLGIKMLGGKNNDRTDEWMNNQQKNMMVPVIKGAIVKAKVYYTNNASFNGEEITYDADTHGAQGNVVYTYTYTGDEPTEIAVNVGNQFLSYISVTYPVTNTEEQGEGQDFSITWSMANGANSTATTSVDDVTLSSSWTMSAKIEVNSTATYGGNVITKFNPTVDHNPRVERNTDYYVEWTFKPYPGFTFTPTSVSFDAVKCGTGDPTIDVDFTDGTGVTEKLATNAAINRDGSGDPSINHSYTMATATNGSGDAVTLRIYIGKCKSDKQVALGRVVINGKISGEKQTFTTVYNIASSLYDNDKTYQGNTGTMAATTAEEAANAPELEIDATSGKLGKNTADWAQLTEGTVLTLPGVPAGAEITFALYNTTALTINGVAYTNGQSYTATEDENVVMTCTTGGYIKSITVTGPAFVEPLAPTEGYTNTWYFGKSSGAPEFALQNSAEYTYTVNDYSLVINTATGKLNNASRSDQWAQCNDGTTFKVPVYAGSKLTWGRYNGGSETGFTIDGQLYNEYYVATADGTVEMKAKGIGYLSYIKIEPITLYEVSGTISGADINDTPIIFTANGNGQPYTAVIANAAFTLSLPADTYTPGLSDDVAYVISSPTSTTVSAAGDLGVFTIVQATAQTVSGAITNAPAEEAFTLTFTNTSNQTTQVQCEAGATSYTASLMPSTYVISSNVGTLSPLSQESFKIVKAAITHNIYFPEAASPAATEQTIIVDNTITTETANNYKSVTNALAAAKAGNIAAPVITLTSGQTFREQVVIDQANVTFTTTDTEKAKITFYYGIGYCYYSLNASGVYDKDRAMTRNSIKKIDPVRWGATVLLRGSASGFKAENIIFENSFNQYYTDEEVIDGVTPNGCQSITYDRTLGPNDSGYKAADSKTVTERAAAIAFENNPSGCELHNCEFIGSQDTFYSSGSIYVKNCNIVGNTDYIFGGGEVVFDNCDLTIGGYSDQSATAYITANSPSATEAYIFRDCTVKSGGRAHVSANLGRDWGGSKANVYYFNLKNNIGNKLSYTWQNMGGGIAAGKANLHIYDFDPTVNANYSTTGSTGANINGLVSDADALSLYAGVVSRLGFTPKHIYDDNVVLDEASYYNVCRIAASDNVERTVKLTRAIGADKWNTIVLPFDLTEAQVKQVFGEGVKVAALTSGTSDKLSFSTVTEMVANQPYAIKVADAFSSATLEGVTVKYSEAPTQTVGNWQFVGTYTKGKVPTDSYFFSSNTLYQAEDETNTIKAFRGWFTYNGATPARQLTFSVDSDSETTGISEIENSKSKIENYYNLNGQRVEQPRKGLYIVNGKKIVIK